MRLLGGGVGRLRADRLFVPGDVPISPEFAALLGEVGDALEPEALVEPDRGRVRQRDARVGTVHVLTFESLEQPLIEARSPAAADRVGGEVDAGLDRRLVSRLRAEAAAAGESDDDTFGNRDYEAVAPRSVVVREPLPPRVRGQVLDIERVMRLRDVLVVDVVHGGEVLDSGRPYLDPRVDHHSSLLPVCESTYVIGPQLRHGPHSSRGHVVPRPAWRAARGARAAAGVQGGHR